MTIEADFNNGIQTIIDALGSDLQLTDSAGTVRTVRGAITTIGKEDAVLVDAVGVEGRILYFLPMTPAPVKFDTITSPSGREYSIHDVHEIFVNSVLVGYKCVIGS